MEKNLALMSLEELREWKNDEEQIKAESVWRAHTLTELETLNGIVLKMHKENFSNDIISKCTGLNMYQVEAILEPNFDTRDFRFWI